MKRLLPLFVLACNETPTAPIESFCGDGARSELEACDGTDLGGEDCFTAGFEGGALSCTPTCGFDTSQCTGDGPRCGDGILEGVETCDAADLGGASCTSLGFTRGTLGCNPACTFDLTGCVDESGSSCGDGVLDLGEECDGTPSSGCLEHGFAGGVLGCSSTCRIDTSACLSEEPYPGDDLESATGCEGVYNPEQLLTYHLDLPGSDWTALLGDTAGTTYFEAAFRCEDGPSIVVGVRRKRSGGGQKPGLKIEFDQFVPGQTFHDLRKLSLEVGVSSGSSEESDKKDIVTEYLANRMMYLSGAVASRAAFAEVHVNGASIGVYASVEDIGKRFLRDRIGDDSGWLYKKSGGGDGYKTNESMPNPYEEYFCFWRSNGCETPSADELAAMLPTKLDIDQFLRVGAVNALIGNTDGPLFKDNNYLFYDWAAGPRLYFAWDLDTVMKESFDPFTGGGGGGNSSGFSGVLFTHWEDDYDQILTDLVEMRLPLSFIEAELDRALAVSGDALDADPYAGGDSAAAAVEDLRTWWQVRHADVAAQVAAH